MLLSLAWRNLWRNTRRTVITMTALGLGVAGIVSIRSYRANMFGIMVEDITRGLVGHLQVHGTGYQESPNIATVVQNPQQVEAALATAVPGLVTERRVTGAGLAGAGDQSAPVMIVGLAPGEPAVGTHDGHSKRPAGLHSVVQGHDLSRDRSHEALLGVDLARDLGVAVGSELVLVGQAIDGSVANDRYTIVGTFTSASAELDSVAVMLSLKDAQDFFALGDGVHQLVVRLPEGVDAEDVASPLSAVRNALDLSTLEALSWGEILPELKETMRQKRKGQVVIDMIVLLIVGLGVFNAMTMAMFERTKEFGVLASLGTRPLRILAMVLLEAVLQALIAFAVGVGLAAALTWGIGTADLSNVMQGDMMGARMPTLVEMRLDPSAIRAAAIISVVTMLLGSLIPAVRAARLRPVEAMRHT